MVRWKKWEIGYYDHKGRWRKITTIFAADVAAARTKGHAALCRPGRHDAYRRWKSDGCDVLEV